MTVYVLWARMTRAFRKKTVEAGYSEVVSVDQRVANDELKITFVVPMESHGPAGRTHVHVRLFDATGQEVPGKTAVQDYTPGKHEITLELEGMRKGRYSYCFEAPGHRVERWFTYSEAS